MSHRTGTQYLTLSLLIVLFSSLLFVYRFLSVSAAPVNGVTELASISTAGEQGNSFSFNSSISAYGRFVVFYSEASNLVSGDTNGEWDVFVRDRQTGETERVSVSSTGEEGDAVSQQAAISADGRYIAFESYATNLVNGDTNGARDIFVHDRQAGTTERISVSSTGEQANSYSSKPAISADGRFVAFDSNATNLVEGDTNGTLDVFVFDRQTGVTERVSVNSSSEQGDDSSNSPAISGNGRYVAFRSDATNMISNDTNFFPDVFVHDRQTGVTERVSVSSTGEEGDHFSYGVSISADGRYVAFGSSSTNLVIPEDVNEYLADIFVHDRQTDETVRVSVSSVGEKGDADSDDPAISADGRLVAFSSAATNLVSGDTNGEQDIFVHNLLTGETERVSVSSIGEQGNDYSVDPSISANGSIVVFESQATNLVSGDINGTQDVFAHTRIDPNTAPRAFLPIMTR
jgi:hypothetical protein